MVPSGNLDHSAIRHYDQEPARISSNVIDTSNLKSSVDSTAKSTLRRIAESSNIYFPLKSVAKDLCFVLDNCKVWSLPDARFIVLTIVLGNGGEPTSHRVIGTTDQSACRIVPWTPPE